MRSKRSKRSDKTNRTAAEPATAEPATGEPVVGGSEVAVATPPVQGAGWSTTLILGVDASRPARRPHPAGMIVGFDGSPSSEAALRWAKARTDLFGPVTPVTETSGDAGAALVRHGRQAELIVVGCRGRQHPLSSFFGSVSGHVVSHATVPVAVVPTTPTPASGRGRVIVGVDGSDSSVHALAWAIRTMPPHTLVEVVHVWHHGINRLLERRATIPSVRVELEAMEILDATVEEARREAGGSRRKILTHLEYGDPTKVLRDFSSGAELLVLGASRHPGRGRLLVGSVASHLIHQPLTTTIVVPPTETWSASRG